MNQSSRIIARIHVTKYIIIIFCNTHELKIKSNLYLPMRKQQQQAFVIHHTTCQLKMKLEGL